MPLTGIPRLRGLVRQGEELTPLVPGKPDGLKPHPSNPGMSHRPPWAGGPGGSTRGKDDGTPGGGGVTVTCPEGDAAFTFVQRFSNLLSRQGVAAKGEFLYTTSHDASNSAEYGIAKYDRALDLVKLRWVQHVPSLNGISQVNGVFYNNADDSLYVSGNNWSGAPNRGWVMRLDPETLEILNTWELSGGRWTEAITRWNGSWWEVNASAHEIRQFDDAFALVQAHALPDADPGQLYWQGVIVINNIFYVNLHEGAGAPDVRAYEWNGAGFDAVATALSPPSNDATQGLFFDGCAAVYWAERTGFHNVIKTTAVDALTLFGLPVEVARDGEVYEGFTLTAKNGTAPYTFSVADGSLPPGLSLDSATGAVTGTPTADGSYTGIVFKVTDDVGSEQMAGPFTIDVFPAALSGVNISVSARAERLRRFPLAIDLSTMPASFWSNVTADGGNIRVYGEHGSTMIPIDVVSIDTGTETGWIVVNTDLYKGITTLLSLRLDGDGLLAANDPNGREAVWPADTYFGVYAFTGDLTDRTAHGNDLTVNVGAVTYITAERGLGGGIDTDAADFQAVKDLADLGGDAMFPLTLGVTGKLTTNNAQNNYAIMLATAPFGTRQVGIGENNANGKWSIFDGSFKDHSASVVLNQSAVAQAVVTAENPDRFVVDGVVVNSSFGDVPGPAADCFIIGNAGSESYWRGEIGFAYFAKADLSNEWLLTENQALANNATFLTVSGSV